LINVFYQPLLDVTYFSRLESYLYHCGFQQRRICDDSGRGFLRLLFKQCELWLVDSQQNCKNMLLLLDVRL